MLGGLRLEKHPDKTFIGRIERGFDFLGYHFSRGGLRIAKATIERFVERATRLYEQDRKEPCSPSRFGIYVKRWSAWSGAGIVRTASRGDRCRRAGSHDQRTGRQLLRFIPSTGSGSGTDGIVDDPDLLP